MRKPFPDYNALSAEARRIIDAQIMRGWSMADVSYAYGYGSLDVDRDNNAIPANVLSEVRSYCMQQREASK